MNLYRKGGLIALLLGVGFGPAFESRLKGKVFLKDELGWFLAHHGRFQHHEDLHVLATRREMMTVDGNEDVANIGLGMLAELLDATGGLAFYHHPTLKRLDDDAIVAAEMHAILSTLRQEDGLASARADLTLILQAGSHTEPFDAAEFSTKVMATLGKDELGGRIIDHGILEHQQYLTILDILGKIDAVNHDEDVADIRLDAWAESIHSR